jgi:SAM-dependent methyltransferase
MLTQAPAADWIVAHRDVWSRKASLRRVYGDWFRMLRGACAPGLPVVELGCGPGFFKEHYPEIVATDAGENPRADRVVDAAALPFDDGEVADLVMLDVFHHLGDPAAFLREAARVLRVSGRLVMLEPWLGLAGRVFFRCLHFEICDSSVDPDAPWAAPKNDPMQGNAALPHLYFRAGGHLERLGLPLRVVRRDRFAALPWLLSGGFQSFSLLPDVLVRPAESIDRLLSRLPGLTATRCLLVVERTA